MAGATVNVRPDLKAELESLAAQTRRDQTDLANEALSSYLGREKLNIARIRAGLEQARRGEFVSEKEMQDFYAKHRNPGA